MIDREFEVQGMQYEIKKLEEELAWEQDAINMAQDLLDNAGVPLTGAEGHGIGNELTLVQRIARMAKDYELGVNVRKLAEELKYFNVYCYNSSTGDTTIEGKNLFYYDDVNLDSAFRGAVEKVENVD